MDSIVIRETNEGWVIKLDFSFSKEVKLNTLDEATRVADRFHAWVNQFQKYAAPAMKVEEKKE